MQWLGCDDININEVGVSSRSPDVRVHSSRRQRGMRGRQHSRRHRRNNHDLSPRTP